MPFTPMPTSWPQKVCASIQGPEGEGKTSLAFSAPGPIGYINLDFGWQRARERFADKDIFVEDIRFPEIPEDANPEMIKRLFSPVYKQFSDAFFTALATMRTTVVDTFTSAYGLLRLADLGSLNQVKGKQYAYVPTNEEMSRLLSLYRDLPSNLLLIHRETDEWVNDSKTGKRKFDGWTQIPDKVNDMVRCSIVDGQFNVSFLKSKTRPQLTGTSFVATDNAFIDMAMMLYPNTLPTDWI
jgi:hypothetical protein